MYHLFFLDLDSEWHWIFDCPKFNGIRAKHPYLRDSLESIRSNSEYAELNDLCKLLNAIQIDSRLGFSVVSFVRQAITLREKWMGDACVRGRLCNTPGHWGRNLIRYPPRAEELPHDFEQAFWNGWPWFFFSARSFFPMKVIGLLQNNLVRTNHTSFYYVSTHLYISFM